MIEWATLVVLVPLVLVPIVLLFGFAGCGELLPPVTEVDPPAAPSDLVATAVGEHQIDLAWQHPALGGVTFVVAAAGPDGVWNDHHGQTTEPSFSSKNLAPGTTFSFRVRAARNGTESGPSNVATARTWQWQTAYETPLANNDAALAGYCLVQRFDHSILKLAPGTTVRRVRLTLRGSANQNGTPLQIAQISISHAAPDPPPGTPGPSAWDSEPPVRLLGSASLPGDGTALTLDEVDFPLSAGRDLLVAFDIDAANTSQTRRVQTGVGASTCYVNTSAAEAATADRSATGWNPRPGVYLVEKIEVLVA